MANELFYIEIDRNAFQRIQKNVQVLAERFNKQAEEVSMLWAQKFVELARKQLATYLTERAARVPTLTEMLSNIYCEKHQDGWYVMMRPDVGSEPNVMLFLEYGTGLVGEQSAHPQASKIGWQYAVNRDKYATAGLYKEGGETIKKTGWFFTYDDSALIANEDVVYSSKEGTLRAVLSSGLLPARFIYDTKRKLDTVYALSFQRSGKTAIFNMDRFKNLLGKVS